jgi:ankyrin repeat protein
LLEHKADPEIRNDNGRARLPVPPSRATWRWSRALVEGGAQVEGSSFDGRTALMMAAMFNRRHCRLPDQQGADPKARDANGITALEAARTMGAVDTVAQLEKLLG